MRIESGTYKGVWYELEDGNIYIREDGSDRVISAPVGMAERTLNLEKKAITEINMVIQHKEKVCARQS